MMFHTVERCQKIERLSLYGGGRAMGEAQQFPNTLD
jgi:hypothetical protein